MPLEIALISPRRTLWARNEATKQALHRLKQFVQPWYTPNLGLLTIAALTPEAAHFTYIDEQRVDLTFKEEYDLIAISAMTQQAKRAYSLADEFRKRGRFVVMGGMHPTLLPDEAKEHADTLAQAADAAMEKVKKAESEKNSEKKPESKAQEKK